MPVLVIGCGNPDRGDDAAGLLVARRLREAGIEARELAGEATTLIEAWAGASHVILVDAVVTGQPPGEVHVWDARNQRVSREAFPCSTHNFGVADAIELGRILDRLPPKLTVYGIEGSCFEVGAEPSAEVLEAVDRVAERIQEEAVRRFEA